MQLPNRNEWQDYSYEDFQIWLHIQDNSVQQAFEDAEVSPIVFESYDPYLYEPPSYEDCLKIFALAGIPHDESASSDNKSLANNTRRFSSEIKSFQTNNLVNASLIDQFFKACRRSESMWKSDTFGAGIVNSAITAGTDEDAIFAVLDSLSTPDQAKAFRAAVEKSPLAQGMKIEELIASELEGRSLGNALGRLRSSELGSNYFLGDAYFGSNDFHHDVMNEVRTLGHGHGPSYTQNTAKLVEMLTSDLLSGDKIFPEESWSVETLKSLPFIALEALLAARGNVLSRIRAVIGIENAANGKNHGLMGACFEFLRENQNTFRLHGVLSGFERVYRDFVEDLKQHRDFRKNLEMLNQRMSDVMREAYVFKTQENVGLLQTVNNAQTVVETSLVTLGASVTMISGGALAPMLASYAGSSALVGTSALGYVAGYGTGLGLAAGAGAFVQTGAALTLDTNLYGKSLTRERGEERFNAAMVNTSLTAATMGIGAGTRALGEMAVAGHFVSKPAEYFIRGMTVSQFTSSMNKFIRLGRFPTGEERLIYGISGFVSAGAQIYLVSSPVENFIFGYSLENIEGNLETMARSGTLTTADVLGNAAGAFSEVAGLYENPSSSQQEDRQEINPENLIPQFALPTSDGAMDAMNEALWFDLNESARRIPLTWKSPLIKPAEVAVYVNPDIEIRTVDNAINAIKTPSARNIPRSESRKSVDLTSPLLQGAALLHAVSDQTKINFRARTYEDAKSKMFSTIDNVMIEGACGVYCSYSEVFVSGDSSQGKDYVEQGDQNGDHHVDSKGMNVEHLWPQSFFKSHEPMRSDMHHLLPTFSYPNNQRGRLSFGEVDDDAVTYSTSAGAKAEKNHFFEPPDSAKGRVARSLFYFYARYRDSRILPEDFQDSFWNDRLETLMEWNKNFPPDAWEHERNDRIERYQGNRNPFVDNPELAERIGVENFKIKN